MTPAGIKLQRHIRHARGNEFSICAHDAAAHLTYGVRFAGDKIDRQILFHTGKISSAADKFDAAHHISEETGRSYKAAEFVGYILIDLFFIAAEPVISGVWVGNTVVIAAKGHLIQELTSI